MLPSLAGRKKPFPWHILVFLTPAMLIYTTFMVFPLLDSLRLSFYARDAAQVERFVGVDNYVRLLSDPLWAPRFWGALKNNLVFFAVHMLVQNPLALLLAVLLSQRGRARTVYRTLIFTPTLLSVVIIGFIWQLILNPLWGIAQSALQLAGLGFLFKPWLGDPDSALITLSLISVWQYVGIPMLLFYAALIAIPDDLTEAARVDGATGWGIFWRIKFPLLLPTIGIVSVLTFVGNFNAFDLIYTMKGALAGPDFATDIMGTLFYRTFFGFQLQLGNPSMGATVAAMMFLIILSGVLVYILWQRRIQTYEL
jgi:raffinose/stachyose/melibiose transport system permease protein